MKRIRAAGCLALGLVGACSPALDWREVRPEKASLLAMFPCKPQRQVRQLQLAGGDAAVQLLGCQADGITWGLSTADLGDADRVSAALAELRSARVRNLSGLEEGMERLRLEGMAPADQALRFQVSGQRPDGTPLAEHSLVFSHGTRVYHAAVLGGAPTAEALEAFFGGLRLQP